MPLYNQQKDWRVELQDWVQHNPRTEPAALSELRASFVARFPKEKLSELTLEQYAEGLGSKDTFCYWLEIKTKKLGGIQGATAAKFGVWWSRRDNTWKWVKRYKSAEEALSQFRQGFIELISAAESKSYEELDDIGSRYLGSGNHMVRAKFLALYFHEQFLPIFSYSHLEYYLAIFEKTPIGGVITRNRQLLKALQSLPEFDGFDVSQIGHFLYDQLPPKKEKWDEASSEIADESGTTDSLAHQSSRARRLREARSAEPITGLESHPELQSEDESESAEPSSQVEVKPVVSEPKDWTISSLREKWERSQIDLQPDYQREYVWRLKPELPSRLIESILLQIPIPPIYLGKLPNNKFDVIDGQQRLTTLIKFIRNEFVLRKLETLKGLNGSSFATLPMAYQDALLDASIRCIVIDPGENQEIRYQIFERLNRGAMSLNEQEIRTCVYRGPLTDLLGELEGSEEWRKVKGTTEAEPRFAEREMILRFFALAARIDFYAGNLKKFLNDYMNVAPKESAQIVALRKSFLQTMQNVYAVFGANSGRLFTIGTETHPVPEGRWESQFSISALDIQAGALVGQQPAKIREYAERIQAAYVLYLLSNPHIRLAITQRPAAKDATKLRWNGFKVEVQEILAGHAPEHPSSDADNPLKDAKLLIRLGLHTAAGARAGVALEKHLKQLCQSHQPPISFESDAGINRVNMLLKQSDVFDQARFLLVQWMGNIRNRCDHPTDNPPSNQEITELIARIEDLMTLFPL